MLHPNSAEKKALSSAALDSLLPKWKPGPGVFHPRPEEIPEELRTQATRIRGLAQLLQKETYKTIQAFNAQGFTFPHELDVILRDLEHKADQLFIYLDAKNYAGRIYTEGNSPEANSQDKREEAK